MPFQSKCLAQPPLETVPFDGAAMLFRDAQADACGLTFVAGDEQQQHAVRRLTFQRVNSLEVATAVQTYRRGKYGVQHVNRLDSIRLPLDARVADRGAAGENRATTIQSPSA